MPTARLAIILLTALSLWPAAALADQPRQPDEQPDGQPADTTTDRSFDGPIGGPAEAGGYKQDGPTVPDATTEPPASAPPAARKAPPAAAPDAEAPKAEPAPWLRARVVSELGFADVLAHTVQFSKNGTEFDYIEDGGQDVLFPYMRLSIEGTIKQRHTLIFLYAPLDLQTNVLLERDVSIDNETFAAGSAVDTRYNFPVFRISYLYNLFDEHEGDELSFGASLQLRNAIIDFTSADGLKRRTNRNVGPVPILKARAKKVFESGLWVGAEVDGFYANIRYINGGDEDILGAIIDANARVGARLTDDLDAFFNVRYFGGGGEGTNTDDVGPGDGFVANWLHVSTITLGFIWRGPDL